MIDSDSEIIVSVTGHSFPQILLPKNSPYSRGLLKKTVREKEYIFYTSKYLHKTVDWPWFWLYFITGIQFHTDIFILPKTQLNQEDASSKHWGNRSNYYLSFVTSLLFDKPYLLIDCDSEFIVIAGVEFHTEILLPKAQLDQEYASGHRLL